MLKEALTRHESMIVAFGDLHGCLTLGSHRNAGCFAGYLDRLCRALNGATLKPLGITLTAAIADGFEPACPPERIGLILAELVTNAAKHAFQGRSAGTVAIALQRRDARWQLAVSDNGRGLAGKKLGVGAGLIETLARAAGGTLTVETRSGGTTFTVTFAAET